MLIELQRIFVVVDIVFQQILAHRAIKVHLRCRDIRCRQRYTQYYELVISHRLLPFVRQQPSKRFVVLLYDNLYLSQVRLRIFVEVTLCAIWCELSVAIVEILLIVFPINLYLERTAKTISTTHVDRHFLCYCGTCVNVKIQNWQLYLKERLYIFAIVIHRVIPNWCRVGMNLQYLMRFIIPRRYDFRIHKVTFYRYVNSGNTATSVYFRVIWVDMRRRNNICRIWCIVTRYVAQCDYQGKVVTALPQVHQVCDTRMNKVVPLAISKIFAILIVWFARNYTLFSKLRINIIELVRFKARRKRIDVRCIVIVNDFGVWVIASSVRIDFFIYGFHVDARHQCGTRKWVLD